MVGLVIAAHGKLGEELLATARQIVGELPAAAACSVPPDASPEALRKAIHEAVCQVDQGNGVIVFADLVGGSPCNQSLQLCKQQRIEVVTGFNLPMLIKANSLRLSNKSLVDLAHELTSYGQRAITCATDLLRRATG